MAYPPKYYPEFIFAQAAFDAGILPKTDEELGAIQQSINAIVNNIEELVQEDGTLKEGSVTFRALDDEVVQTLASTAANFAGNWATATAYTTPEIVVQDGLLYMCLAGHTSGTFLDDLAVGNWALIGYVGDGDISTLLGIRFLYAEAVADGNDYTLTFSPPFTEYPDNTEVFLLVRWPSANVSAGSNLIIDGLAAAPIYLGTAAVDAGEIRQNTTDIVVFNDDVRGGSLPAFELVGRTVSAGGGGGGGGDFATGDIKATFAAVASGWLICEGATIGNVGSGATYQDAAYEDLFNLMVPMPWNAGTEVWASGHTVKLPDLRNTVPMGLTSGKAGTSVTVAIGETAGAETHTLITDEIPAHTHTGSTGTAGNHSHSYEDVRPVSGSTIASGSGKGTSSESKTTTAAGNHAHSITMNNTGGGQPHNNVQPVMGVRYVIKV